MTAVMMIVVSESMFLSTGSVRRECMSIVSMLPSNHWNKPEDFEFLRSDDVSTDNLHDVIRGYLFNQCIARYSIINLQIDRNYDIMMNNGNRSAVALDQRNLIVLDVDETILDQRSMMEHKVPTSAQRRCPFHNSDDLLFGVRTTKFEGVHYVVFRPFLMEFIHENQESANFVLYSLAEPTYLIYDVVLIEMYYNFVARMSRFRGAPIFKFGYVIGRTSKFLEHKSLLILDALIGDIDRFRNIYLVDDMADEVMFCGDLTF